MEGNSARWWGKAFLDKCSEARLYIRAGSLSIHGRMWMTHELKIVEDRLGDDTFERGELRERRVRAGFPPSNIVNVSSQ